jgi:hypothetical protein
MAKKDIGKILTTGSPKQRILLIAEDIARGKYFQEKLLTDSDFNQLSNSFKKPNEIKLWNEFRKLDGTVSDAIDNLQGVKFEVLMNYSNLRGYILLWNSIENTELLVNSVLHEIKDHKERKRIAERGAKGVHLLFSKTKLDQEGYIEIKVDFTRDTYTDENGKLIEDNDKPRKTKEYSLWDVMSNVKKDVESSVIKYLSWEAAILDFMEDRGFNVKTYKEAIKQMTTQIYNPIIGWAKYSGELDKKFTKELSHPALERVLSKYAICPNIEELKIDETMYSWFKINILGDE